MDIVGADNNLGVGAIFLQQSASEFLRGAFSQIPNILHGYIVADGQLKNEKIINFSVVNYLFGIILPVSQPGSLLNSSLLVCSKNSS